MSAVVVELVIDPTRIEILNGMLLMAFTVVLADLAIYLVAEFYRRRHETVKSAAHHLKPTIAVGVIFLGVWLRSFIFWYLRHAENFGWSAPFWRPYADLLATVGTVAAVFGCFCWYRVTVTRKWGHIFWPLAMILSIGFPIWLATP